MVIYHVYFALVYASSSAWRSGHETAAEAGVVQQVM
jgi:hypothetical protein